MTTETLRSGTQADPVDSLIDSILGDLEAAMDTLLDLKDDMQKNDMPPAYIAGQANVAAKRAKYALDSLNTLKVMA